MRPIVLILSSQLLADTSGYGSALPEETIQQFLATSARYLSAEPYQLSEPVLTQDSRGEE